MINKSATCRSTFNMKHKHHIIPRHMGGTDDSSNIIELTVEEHALAHLKLYEQHKKNEDFVAYHMLSGQSRLDPVFRKAYCSLGGKSQGTRNAESGHMTKIQKLSDPALAGKKGGKKTIELGKGSFGDPVQRLKSASKGGKTQGKKNAESGHLQRIAQLPNKRSKGKVWITNGTSNKMIDPLEKIPEGYAKGKIQKQ